MRTFKNFLEANQPPPPQQPNSARSQPAWHAQANQELKASRLEAYQQLSAAVRALENDPEWSQNQQFQKSCGLVHSFLVNLGGTLRLLYGEQPQAGQ